MTGFGPEEADHGIWEDTNLYSLTDQDGNTKGIFTHAVVFISF